jgi:hypothetical protein
MEPQRIDKMVEMLGQATGRQLATFDVFLVASRKVVLPEPRESANDELQRLSQVMSRHWEQHRIELAGALQGVFAARNDADLGEFNHDTLSLKFLLHFEPFKRWRVDRGQSPQEFKLTESSARAGNGH